MDYIINLDSSDLWTVNVDSSGLWSFKFLTTVANEMFFKGEPLEVWNQSSVFLRQNVDQDG